MDLIIPPTDRAYYLFASKVVGEMCGIIAVPVVILAFLGNWIDDRYGFSPFATIGGMIIAGILSSISIYRKTLEFSEEYKKITSTSTPKDDKNQ
jgi:F0F1-type ATP synthase assembly protein I